MLSPTSMSAMSIERISNAVPASSPFSSTRREIESGLASTSLCDSAEPIVVVIPLADPRDDRLHPWHRRRAARCSSGPSRGPSP